MKQVDAVVIGGGVLGCFAARNLRKWNISTLLLESGEDVCTGVTRANSAIVYAGYDNRSGSLKAAMTAAGNAAMETLCTELEVPFRRTGSFLVSFGERGDGVLRRKLENGRENGVPELELLCGEEARQREPFLSPNARSALYAPTTGTVNPWLLGIAAYENAVENGCEVRMRAPVRAISASGGGYIVETDGEIFSCKAVLNCAGLYADRVQELLFPPSVRIFWDSADFLLLDRHIPAPEHILFHETENGEKGVTAVPTAEGNLLLEGSRRPLEGELFSTTPAGLSAVRQQMQSVLPKLDGNRVLRSFAAVRPNPYRVVKQGGEYVWDGKSIGNFVIAHPASGFFSLIGIKTPGLTCAQELGAYLAAETAKFLDAAPNKSFDGRRRAIHRKNHDIVCMCGGISEAEILEAIARGAATVDGVKRRVGTGMGRCQGSRCAVRIEELLEASHGRS